MSDPISPKPDGATRAGIAQGIRVRAADMAATRGPHVPQDANDSLARALEQTGEMIAV